VSEGKAISGVLGGALAGGLISAIGLTEISRLMRLLSPDKFREVLRETFEEENIRAVIDDNALYCLGPDKLWFIHSSPTPPPSFAQIFTSDGLYFPSDTHIHSIRAYRYPVMEIVMMLPSKSIWIGFENGHHYLGGIATMRAKAGAEFYIGIGRGDDIIGTDVLSILPSDVATSYYTYRIRVARSMVIFERSGGDTFQFLGFGINSPAWLQINPPPYAIFGRREAFPNPVMRALIEPVEPDALLPVAWCPSNCRIFISDGEPNPPLVIPLYVTSTSTLLAGYSLSSGSVTSHPVPMAGYYKKSIYFMANQAGSLDIQILTQGGNWRTYDTVSMSANTLMKYRIEDEVILARIVFTPSTYPATILEAEADMS
jgi:hypothetical protein